LAQDQTDRKPFGRQSITAQCPSEPPRWNDFLIFIVPFFVPPLPVLRALPNRLLAWFLIRTIFVFIRKKLSPPGPSRPAGGKKSWAPAFPPLPVWPDLQRSGYVIRSVSRFESLFPSRFSELTPAPKNCLGRGQVPWGDGTPTGTRDPAKFRPARFASERPNGPQQGHGPRSF